MAGSPAGPMHAHPGYPRRIPWMQCAAWPQCALHASCQAAQGHSWGGTNSPGLLQHTAPLCPLLGPPCPLQAGRSKHTSPWLSPCMPGRHCPGVLPRPSPAPACRRPAGAAAGGAHVWQGASGQRADGVLGGGAGGGGHGVDRRGLPPAQVGGCSAGWMHSRRGCAVRRPNWCSCRALGLLLGRGRGCACRSSPAPIARAPARRDKREEAAEAHARFRSAEGDHPTLLAVFRAYSGVTRKGGERASWCRSHFINPRAMRKALDIHTQARQGRARGDNVLFPWNEVGGAPRLPRARNGAAQGARRIRARPPLSRPGGPFFRPRVAWVPPPLPDLAPRRDCLQLREHMQALGIPLRSCGEDSLPLRRALVAGLFPHAAKRQLDGESRVGRCRPAGVASPRLAASRQGRSQRCYAARRPPTPLRTPPLPPQAATR